MDNLKVIQSGGKFWVSIGSISFGQPLNSEAEAELVRSWFFSAMPGVIEHIADKQHKKEGGKVIAK